MFKILIGIIAIAFAVNTASAMTEAEVAKYVLDTVPGSTNFDARSCADAHRNGGEFIVKIHDITLKCSKNTLIKDWDLSKN